MKKKHYQRSKQASKVKRAGAEAAGRKGIRRGEGNTLTALSAESQKNNYLCAGFNTYL